MKNYLGKCNFEITLVQCINDIFCHIVMYNIETRNLEHLQQFKHSNTITDHKWNDMTVIHSTVRHCHTFAAFIRDNEFIYQSNYIFELSYFP